MSAIEAPAASATDQPRPRRLGRIESLLIEAGVVTHEVLAMARDRQRGAKRPLLEILLEQEAVNEDLLSA